MSAKIKAKKEEDPFSEFKTDRRPSPGQLFVYLPSAIAVTLIPLYLYHSIFGMDLQSYAPLFAVVTALSTLFVTIAYHNISFWLKTRLSTQRDKILTKGSVTDKVSDKKVALENKKQSQAAVTRTESMAFSILYNNALFLFSVLVLAFIVFKNASAPYNYVFSIALSAGLLSFTSSASV
ncbi:SWI/SNF and RSC complex subunit Ssr3 [Balamuthia mandrillaris]